MRALCVSVFIIRAHTKLKSAQLSSQEERKKTDDNISKTKNQIVK